MHLFSASRSARQSEELGLARLSGADAVVLQSNCVAKKFLKVPIHKVAVSDEVRTRTLHVTGRAP